MSPAEFFQRNRNRSILLIISSLFIACGNADLPELISAPIEIERPQVIEGKTEESLPKVDVVDVEVSVESSIPEVKPSVPTRKRRLNVRQLGEKSIIITVDAHSRYDGKDHSELLFAWILGNKFSNSRKLQQQVIGEFIKRGLTKPGTRGGIFIEYKGPSGKFSRPCLKITSPYKIGFDIIIHAVDCLATEGMTMIENGWKGFKNWRPIPRMRNATPRPDVYVPIEEAGRYKKVSKETVCGTCWSENVWVGVHNASKKTKRRTNPSRHRRRQQHKRQPDNAYLYRGVM